MHLFSFLSPVFFRVFTEVKKEMRMEYKELSCTVLCVFLQWQAISLTVIEKVQIAAAILGSLFLMASISWLVWSSFSPSARWQRQDLLFQICYGMYGFMDIVCIGEVLEFTLGLLLVWYNLILIIPLGINVCFLRLRMIFSLSSLVHYAFHRLSKHNVKVLSRVNNHARQSWQEPFTLLTINITNLCCYFISIWMCAVLSCYTGLHLYCTHDYLGAFINILCTIWYITFTMLKIKCLVKAYSIN